MVGDPPKLFLSGPLHPVWAAATPLSSVVEKYEVAKCRVILSLRDSNDDLVKQAGVTTRSSGPTMLLWSRQLAL